MVETLSFVFDILLQMFASFNGQTSVPDKLVFANRCAIEHKEQQKFHFCCSPLFSIIVVSICSELNGHD